MVIVILEPTNKRDSNFRTNKEKRKSVMGLMLANKENGW